MLPDPSAAVAVVVSPMLPDPRERPLLRPDELIGLTPMSRSAIYEAISRGDIQVVRYGRRVYVVNAALQRDWGLDGAGHPDQDELWNAVKASTLEAGDASE